VTERTVQCVRTMRGCLAGVVVALGGFSASGARADDGARVPGNVAPVAAPASSEERSVWYGAEIIVIDLASLALPIVSTRLDDETAATIVAGVGFAGYVVGGPIVHAVNGADLGTVAWSGGLRLALPLAGSFLGQTFTRATEAKCRISPSGFCDVMGELPTLGLALGVLAASIIDVAVLAWKDDKTPDPSAKTGSLRLLPSIGMNRDDGRRSVPTFGVIGSF
jgi:hypothetical protein